MNNIMCGTITPQCLKIVSRMDRFEKINVELPAVNAVSLHVMKVEAVVVFRNQRNFLRPIFSIAADGCLASVTFQLLHSQLSHGDISSL